DSRSRVQARLPPPERCAWATPTPICVEPDYEPIHSNPQLKPKPRWELHLTFGAALRVSPWLWFSHHCAPACTKGIESSGAAPLYSERQALGEATHSCYG